MTITINSASNNYPFASKADIKARLATDNGYVRNCMVIMQTRTEERYAAAARGAVLKCHGFMSSHEKRAKNLVNKILLDEALLPGEMELAREMALASHKQLASHFRNVTKAENPAAAEAGRVFGV